MRIAIFTIASLLLLTGAAAAQGRAPVCSEGVPGRGDAISCYYFSMAQCRYELRGIGGICVRNPVMAKAYVTHRGHRR